MATDLQFLSVPVEKKLFVKFLRGENTLKWGREASGLYFRVHSLSAHGSMIHFLLMGVSFSLISREKETDLFHI